MSLVAGVVLTAAFILWERRVSEPMLPLRLFRSVTFAAANATGFFMTASLTASVFLTAQFFQLGLGYSPLETGLRVLPWTASALIFAPPAGALSDRVGRRPIVVLGLILTAVGLGWYAMVAGPGTPYFPFGSRDGDGAGDHDQPYRFGRRLRASVPYPFNTRQYARLLVLRSRLQDHLAREVQAGCGGSLSAAA